MEIRALRESDERVDFQSGDADLDRFLASYAGQNQFKHHIGTTWVATEKERILGYATVAAGHLEIEDLPAATRKGLPRYPLPILRLGRLAVDKRAQGQGVGKALLRYVLELARRMATDFGCVGVIVDAGPAAVEFYRRYGFFELDAIEGMSAARPAPVAMFLSLGDIEAIIRSRRA